MNDVSAVCVIAQQQEEIERNGSASVIFIMLYFTEGDIFTSGEDTEILMVK